MSTKKAAPNIPAKSDFGTKCTSRSGKGSEISLKAKRERQLSILIDAFRHKPRTILQVARITGLKQSYIHRRVAELRKEHRIFLCGKGVCPISKCRAGYYTTSTKEAVTFYAKSCAPILSGLRGWEKTLIRKAIARIVNEGVTALEAQTQLPIELWADWWRCYHLIRWLGYVCTRLRDMKPSRALAHCANLTYPLWSNAGQDEVIELWRILRDYISNEYKETSIQIPARIDGLWERCKTIIDKEVAR